MSENHLKQKLLKEELEAEEKALDFILNYILAERLARVDNIKDHYIIWKINDADLDTALAVSGALKEMIEMGVDAIITNRPDRLLQILAERK